MIRIRRKLGMKMKIVSMFAVVLFVGCSKTNSPVHFSKIASQTAGQAEVSSQESKESQESTRPQVAIRYTLLEKYLNGLVTKEYVMAWFFEDARSFREKLFVVKDEIYGKMPMSQHDVNLILILEYAMNTHIRKFNDKNIFVRSKDIIHAAVKSADEYDDQIEEYIENYYDIARVKNEGAPAKIISDQPIGFLGSFVRYGFKIEEVNFFFFRE